MREPAIRARRRSPRATCSDGRRPRSAALRRRRDQRMPSGERSPASAAPATSTSTPNTKPSAHAQARQHRDQRRQRARSATRGASAASRRSTASSTSATSMSSRHMRSQPAAAQMMTLADRVARHGDVVAATTVRCAPGASARRCRRSACRRAAAMCVGPVSPDTITRRAARQRDEIGNRRLRRQRSPRRRRAATTSAASVCFARPPQHDRLQPVPLAQRRRRAPPSRAGGQRLFGHAAPGLSSA